MCELKNILERINGMFVGSICVTGEMRWVGRQHQPMDMNLSKFGGSYDIVRPVKPPNLWAQRVNTT